MGQNLILNMNDHGFVVSHKGHTLLGVPGCRDGWWFCGFQRCHVIWNVFLFVCALLMLMTFLQRREKHHFP